MVARVCAVYAGHSGCPLAAGLPTRAKVLHNSAMLLSGMGPVLQEYPSAGAKLFSSFYALFSGIVFIANIGVILAPVIHRIFHRLHLEEDATS